MTRQEENKKYYSNNKDKFKKYNKERKINNPAYLLLVDAKKRSKKMNIDFNLCIEDLKIPEICPILGIPLFFTERSTNK